MRKSQTLLTRQELTNQRNINLESKIDDYAVKFFEKKYQTKLQWHNKKLPYLWFEVNNLRGEVIVNEKKWERLQFSIFYDKENEVLILTFFIPGIFVFVLISIIILKSFNIGFENFEQFKIMLGLLQTIFGAYMGLVLSSQFKN